MASLAVRNAVVARINSQWNGGSPRCPLSLPNEAFLPPADSGPFLSVQFPVSNEDIMELGPAPNFYREDGAIRLVLCFGINQGTDTALAWIDELRAIFRGQRFDGVITYAPSPPIEANDNDSGNYYRLSVAIPYEYDFIAIEPPTVEQAGYTAQAVHFASTVRLTQDDVAFLGVSEFAARILFRLPEIVGFPYLLQIHQSVQVQVGFNYSTDIAVLLGTGATFSQPKFIFGSADGLVTPGVWHELFFYGNTSGAAGSKVAVLRFDGVDVLDPSNTVDDSAPFLIGPNDNALDAALPYYIGLPQTYDFADIWGAGGVTVTDDTAFRDSVTGKPKDPSGFPTGSFLFSGNASAFATNQGTGGAFTLTGSLSDADSSPSD